MSDLDEAALRNPEPGDVWSIGQRKLLVVLSVTQFEVIAYRFKASDPDSTVGLDFSRLVRYTHNELVKYLSYSGRLLCYATVQREQLAYVAAYQALTSCQIFPNLLQDQNNYLSTLYYDVYNLRQRLLKFHAEVVEDLKQRLDLEVVLQLQPTLLSAQRYLEDLLLANAKVVGQHQLATETEVDKDRI